MARRSVGASVVTANVVGILRIVFASQQRTTSRLGCATEPIHGNHLIVVWPTVEHPELARAGVNVSIGTANLLRIGAVAFGRAVGDGTLLRDAVADGNLENVTPAVLDLHLAAAGVDMTIGTANSFGGLPADLFTMTGRLAKFLRCFDNTLPACVAFHLADRLVNVSVGSANGSVPIVRTALFGTRLL